MIRVSLLCLLVACGPAEDTDPHTDTDAGGGDTDDTNTPGEGTNSASGTVGADVIDIEGDAVAVLRESNGTENLGIGIVPAGSTCGGTFPAGSRTFGIYLVDLDGPIEATTYDSSNAHIEAYVRDYDASCETDQVVKNDGVLEATVTITSITAEEVRGTFSIDMYNPQQQTGTITGSFTAPQCGTDTVECAR